MKQYNVRLESDSKYCVPLKCDCNILYLILKPTVNVPIRTSASAFAENVITATISSFRYLGDIDNDGKIEWDYVIEYNEDHLIDSSYSLGSCDVLMTCCNDCQMQVMKAYIDKIYAEINTRLLILETPT